MRDLGPGRRIGRFVIERKLGQGGMGAVFLVADERGARLALKLIAGEDEDWTRRFEREARAALAIRHENVARVLPLEKHEGLLVLPMELLEGGTLKDAVKKRGPLPWEEAVALGAAIARGLAAIHVGGFVHRDLKPANVLLDGSGRPKITDFGLVRRASGASVAPSVLTRTGEIVGTFEYLAPELAEGSKVDARADLYSLGATLYELLSGAPPFAGTGYGLVAKHLRETPASLAPKGVPKELDALVLRLLAKRPDDRPPTATAVAEELEGLLGGKEPAPRSTRGRWIAIPFVLAGTLAAGVFFETRRGPESSAPRPTTPPPPPPAHLGFHDRYVAALEGWEGGKLEAASGHDEPRHTRAVRMVAFFRDESRVQRLVSGGHDGLRIWNPETGEEIGKLIEVPEGVRTLSIAGDGHTVAVGTLARVARTYDLRTGRSLASHEHMEGQVCAAISPDGQTVVSGAGQTPLVRWSARDGNVLETSSDLRFQPLWFLRFTADGQSVVAGMNGGSVLRRHLESDRVDEQASHVGAATEGVVLGDGTIVSVGADHVLQVDRPARAPLRFQVHEDARGLHALAVTPDGTVAVTGADDGFVEVRDLTRSDEPRRFRAHATVVNTVAIDDAGKLIATGSEDGTVRFFDRTGVERRFADGSLKTHRCAILSLALSGDGTLLLTSGEDAAVNRWDVEKMTPTPARIAFQSPVVGIAFVDAHGPNPAVLSLERHHGLKLWRPASDKLIAQLDATSMEGATGLAVGGRDHLAVVSNGWDLPALMYSIEPESPGVFQGSSRLREREPDAPFDTGPFVMSYQAAVASVDSFAVAGAGKEGRNLFVRGNPPHPTDLEVLDGEKDDLWSVAFLDPAGNLVLTGSEHGIVSLWDLGPKTRVWSYRGLASVTQVAALDEHRALVLSGTRVLVLDADSKDAPRLRSSFDLAVADDRPTHALVDGGNKRLWLGTARGTLLRIHLR